MAGYSRQAVRKHSGQATRHMAGHFQGTHAGALARVWDMLPGDQPSACTAFALTLYCW